MTIKDDQESETKSILRDYLEYLGLGLGLFLVYVARIYSFLLFHTIAELMSIIIMGGIFIIGWNSRKYMNSSFFLVIGISFLYIAIIDLLHTLAYADMNIFLGYDSNLPTSLWILARYWQASSFIFATLVINRKINSSYIFIISTIAIFIFIPLIFLGFFPVCYIEAIERLTPFKIISEYIIIFIFFTSLIIFYINRNEFDKKIFVLMIISIVSTMASELTFTFYISVFDFFIVLGHLFKIVAFFFAYKALIETGLESPYKLLFRRLKSSEDALKQKAEDLAEALSETDQIFNASLPLRLISMNYEIIRVNDTFCELFRLNREEIISKKCYDLLPTKFCNTPDCTLKLIQSGKNMVEYELDYELKNGIILTLIVNSVPHRDINGKFIGLIQNYTDITERKLAQEKIEDMARFPAENPNPVIRVSRKYVLLANKEAQRVFNIGEGSRIPNVLLESITNTFSNNQVNRLEIDLNNHTYSFVITPIEGANYVNIYGLDITIRKKAEESLERFVSTVSHELRTPISVLVMSMDYLKNHKETLTPEIEDQLSDAIARNISLLNELVEDILTLSIIDEKKVKIDWKEYKPSTVIKDIINFMQPLEKVKDTDFSISIDDNIKLFGDIKRIEQIFRIFLDNALKYSKENKKIEISAIDNYKGKFNQQDRQGVLFQFKDNGIGISKNDINNLFERFYRSEQVSNIPGTGLGLTIAKELIKLHDGEVYVNSELGKGSTFSIFLPRILSQP
jgi:PAS domain S-box-containing protein